MLGRWRLGPQVVRQTADREVCLDCDGHAQQRGCASGGSGPVGLAGRAAGQFRRQRYEGPQRPVALLDSGQGLLGQLQRAHRPLAQPRELALHVIALRPGHSTRRYAKNMSVHKPAVPLRPGPSQLSREQVAAHQRDRLLLAVGRVVAGRGYAAARVADVLVEARVSRATFYVHYDDLEDCYAAAYSAAADLVRDALLGAGTARREPSEVLRGALRDYLAVLDAHPDLALAFLVQSAGAGPRVRELRRQSQATWAAALQTLAEQAADAAGSAPPSPLAGTCAIGALVHAVEHAVEQAVLSASSTGSAVPPLALPLTPPPTLASLADALENALARLLLPDAP